MKKIKPASSKDLCSSIPFLKKILPALLLACSCHNPHPSIPKATPPTATAQPDSQSQATSPGPQNQPAKPVYKYGNPLLNQYAQWLSTLDTQKISNGSLAVNQYKQLFGKQPRSICDTAYYLFDSFHQRLTDYITHNPDTTDLEPLIMDSRDGKPVSLSPQLIKIRDTLAANGFRIFEEEGNAFVIYDMSFMNKNFSPYVSPAMKEYLAQLAKEDSKPFLDDAALLIPPTELAYRTIWWEQYVHRHSDFIFTYNALHTHRFYFRILLQGTDNTPLVRENNHLTDYYRTAYSFVTTHYPRSETNMVVAPWFKALKTNDTTTIQKIREKFHLE